MKEQQPIFPMSLPRRRLRMALLGTVLLACLATRAEGLICTERPVLTVKEVKGFVVSEATDGFAEGPLAGVEVQLLRETPKGWTAVAEGTTNGEGWFHIPDVRAGVYRIVADEEGLIAAEGRLRVRRFFPDRNRTLFLVLARLEVDSCGGWTELRKGEAEALKIAGE